MSGPGLVFRVQLPLAAWVTSEARAWASLSQDLRSGAMTEVHHPRGKGPQKPRCHLDWVLRWPVTWELSRFILLRHISPWISSLSCSSLGLLSLPRRVGPPIATSMRPRDLSSQRGGITLSLGVRGCHVTPPRPLQSRDSGGVRRTGEGNRICFARPLL